MLLTFFCSAVLELKKEVTAEQYELLRQFPDLRDEQALQDFEVFIGALKSKKVKGIFAQLLSELF